MTDTYTLYGMAASLYTARVRSYMRINAVPFTEVKAGSEEFLGQIVPAIGRWMIPVIKTPDGAIIQDGADIIDHLDSQGFSKHPLYPDQPALLVIAHLFELFGAQGLLRPAMHYRWNFDDVNLPFIRDTFRDVLPTGLPPEAEEKAFLQASGRMRAATLALGAKEDVHAQIEHSYARFLALMNTHLDRYPFLLGGHPTLADYGLIGAMYAHLGRDPAPLQLMQTTAPRVFRWVERMNMAETFVDGAQAESGHELFEGTALPDSLVALLGFIAEDYLPEINAHIEFANAWLDNHPIQADINAANQETARPAMGFASFTWRETQIDSVVIPYRFYLLHRLQDAFDRQSANDQAAIRETFAAAGLEPLLTKRTKRRLVRKDSQEIWGYMVG
ncbi:glutathione S-transferase family protein [Parerythrobacter jejuensis]|nr:glutathione S-transferase family protein [Parerythrobacter jejuensis]